MVLPTDSGVCCIPLIYTQDTSPFKINDVIEITGKLVYAPNFYCLV